MRVEHGPGWLGPTRPLPAEIGGTWAWTQEGKRIWRISIRATAARALRVRFEDFNAQGSVWLYGDEWSGPHVGPYSGLGPHGSGRFWSEFVFSEAVIIEYVPSDPDGSRVVPFRVSSVAHIASKALPFPAARKKPGGFQPQFLAGCHLDASCYPELEDRDLPSVAKLYITNEDGVSECSGVLINTRYDSDSHLLLLTAAHCVDSDELARNLSFLWNYQTERCYGNPDWEWWEKPLAYTYGARLVASKGVDDDFRDDDFTLLALSQPDVLSKTGVTKHGWDPNPVRTGAQVWAVSHPAGSFKRVAFGHVVSVSWTGRSSVGYHSIEWRLGATEPGSSGGPVFDDKGYLVGIVSAANDDAVDDNSPWGPYCDADLRTAFNRFSRIYDAIELYLEDEGELPDLSHLFQSQPVQVALGTSGQSITLLTTEAGGFTLNGEAVSTGDTHAADNGNYTLTLDGTNWTAAFAPGSMDVALGGSGASVTLTQLETGGYGIDGTAIESGGTHTAANGNYTLTMEDGVWMATFAPAMHEVALGASGDSVTIVQMEAGGFSLNGEAITADTTAMASNGATYGVALGADGPMVVYIPSMVTVMLGELGGEIVLTPVEDQQSYLLDGAVFHSGTVIESNGRSYRVTRDASGNWTAAYEGRRVSLRLGDSGSGVILREGEDGSWWIGWTKIESGHIRSAQNGDKYRANARQRGVGGNPRGPVSVARGRSRRLS